MQRSLLVGRVWRSRLRLSGPRLLAVLHRLEDFSSFWLGVREDRADVFSLDRHGEHTVVPVDRDAVLVVHGLADVASELASVLLRHQEAAVRAEPDALAAIVERAHGHDGLSHVTDLELASHGAS